MDKPIYEIPVIGPGGEPIEPVSSSLNFPPPGAHSARLTEPQPASVWSKPETMMS